MNRLTVAILLLSATILVACGTFSLELVVVGAGRVDLADDIGLGCVGDDGESCSEVLKVQRGTYTIEVEPAEGYRLASLLVDGVPVAAGSEFVGDRSNHKIEAVFVEVGSDTLVDVLIDGHGTVDIGDQSAACAAASCADEQLAVSPGTPLTVTATPDTGWTLDALDIDGSPHASGSDYTFVDGGTVEAVFSEVASLCTPTATGAGPPGLSFVNPNGGGCVDALLFLGGSNLGGTGTCVVAGGTVFPIETGSGSSVLRVHIPLAFPTGTTSFLVSTLQGQASIPVQVVDDDPTTATSMSPTTAAAGSSVVITGTHMAHVTQVLFQGSAQPNSGTITARTETSVTFTVPANAGFHTVFVANPCGGATVPGSLEVTN